MTHLLLNLALAATWAALIGELTLFSLVTGFALGYAVLWIAPATRGRRRYLERFWQALGFALYFVRELVWASLRIAHDVVTPRHRMTPAILRVPLDITSDGAITFLAMVVTLTPGTMVLQLSKDRRHMLVHFMYAGDLEAARRSVKEGFERRIMEFLRD